MEKLSAEEKIYFAFYETKKKLLYYNQLKVHTGLSDSSLQNALKKLKKETASIREKANTFYLLKYKAKAKILFSLFDCERLERLNIDVKAPVKKFLAEMPKSLSFVILFGSASRKQEKNGSDIDLLVVLHSFKNKKLQKLYEEEIKAAFEQIEEKISASSIYPLNIFYTTRNSYAKGGNRVVIEAKQSGFCISGNMDYYEVMLNEPAN
ncbi:MAG: nucleotidyltransferase domain-containing protein [Nanoarchaeota archaeon]|nr:nucleotidyltransferase domain-containing protein [Nanoarchaeota archaeon]MBU4300005.1 nucleotidyltransferase domain-containing protein [Nanoarchaeota archaeon]MBU4451167.1 nucleotidyltransferase domain-containing protein [Nanoarchaeota archaeon]MCG2724310.1 nucleotidyltransferase domain-containing protein [archaeon]